MHTTSGLNRPMLSRLLEKSDYRTDDRRRRRSTYLKFDGLNVQLVMRPVQGIADDADINEKRCLLLGLIVAKMSINKALVSFF